MPETVIYVEEYVLILHMQFVFKRFKVQLEERDQKV